MSDATLKDIARLAGYSINTVSLALKSSHRISVDTRERIMKVAEELEYIPNNAARSLVLGKSRTVGLILGNINSYSLISEANYIENYLSNMEYSLSIITSQGNLETETRAINLMLSNKVDGIILNTQYVQNLPRLEHLRESGLPVVLISGVYEKNISLDAVYPDLYRGSYLATKHMLSLGHKRVAYVCRAKSVQDVISRNIKAAGFRKAIEEAGISFNTDLIMPIRFEHVEQQEVNSIRIVGDILEKARKETAFFIGEDETTIPVMKHLIENGISIPDDVAIISMDNTWHAESAIVAVSSVGFDKTEISRRAVDILMGIIQGENREGEYVNQAIAPFIYVRDSCGGRRAQ